MMCSKSLHKNIIEDANGVVIELQLLGSDVDICLNRLIAEHSTDIAQDYIVAAQSDLQSLGELIQQLVSDGLHRLLSQPDKLLDAAISRLEDEFSTCCQKVSLLHEEVVHRLSIQQEQSKNTSNREVNLNLNDNAPRVVPVEFSQEQHSPFSGKSFSQLSQSRSLPGTFVKRTISQDFVRDLPQLHLSYSSSSHTDGDTTDSSGVSSTDTLGSDHPVHTSTPLHPNHTARRSRIKQAVRRVASSLRYLSHASELSSSSWDSLEFSSESLPRPAFSAPNLYLKAKKSIGTNQNDSSGYTSLTDSTRAGFRLKPVAQSTSSEISDNLSSSESGPRELNEQEEVQFIADEQSLLLNNSCLDAIDEQQETFDSVSNPASPTQSLEDPQDPQTPKTLNNPGESLNFSIDSLNCTSPLKSPAVLPNDAFRITWLDQLPRAQSKVNQSIEFTAEIHKNTDCHISNKAMISQAVESQKKSEDMNRLLSSKIPGVNVQIEEEVLDRKTIASVSGASDASSSSSIRRRDEMWAELLPDYTALMEDNLVVQTCKSTADSLDAEGPGLISYSEFLHEYRDISDWLEQLLTTLHRHGASRSEKYLNQSYQEELLSRSSRLTALQEGGLQLIKTYPAVSDQVRERLDTLQQQWNAAEVAAAPGRLHQCPKLMLQDLREDMVCLRDWLDQAEKRQLPLAAEQSLNVEELMQLIEHHKSLQTEIEERSQFVSAVLRLCKQLQTDSRCGNEDERCELNDTAMELERRWQAIWLEALERQYTLEELLRAGGKVGVTIGPDTSTVLVDTSVGDSLSSVISSTDSLHFEPPRRLDQLTGLQATQCGSSDLRAWIKGVSEVPEDERSETLGSEYDTLPFPSWEYEKIVDSSSEGGRLLGDGSDEGIDTAVEHMAEKNDKQRREPGDGGYSSVSSSEEAADKLTAAGTKQQAPTDEQKRVGFVLQTQLMPTKTVLHEEVTEVVREELHISETNCELEQIPHANSELKGIIDSLLVPDSTSSDEQSESQPQQLQEVVDQALVSATQKQSLSEGQLHEPQEKQQRTNTSYKSTSQSGKSTSQSGKKKQRKRRAKANTGAELSTKGASDVGVDALVGVTSAPDVCLPNSKQLTDPAHRTSSLPTGIPKGERTLEVDIDVDLVFSRSHANSLTDTQDDVSEDQRSLAAFSENAWDNLQAIPYSLDGCEDLEPRLEWQPEDSLEPEDFESEFKRMQKLQLRQTQILDDSEAELEELAQVVAESGRQLKIVTRFLEVHRRDSSSLLDLLNYKEVMVSCETNITCLREIVDQFSSESAEGLVRVNRITDLRSAWTNVQMIAQRQHETALSLQQLTRELHALEQYADDRSPKTAAVDEQTLQTALLETQRSVTELAARQQQLTPLSERLTSLSVSVPDTDLSEITKRIDELDVMLGQRQARLDDRLTTLQSRLASWREFRLMVCELQSCMQNDRHQLQDLNEQRQTLSSCDSSSAYSSADENEMLRHDLVSLQKALTSHESRISTLTQLASSLTSNSSQATQDCIQSEVTQIANEIRLLRKQVTRLWEQVSEADLERQKRRQLEVAEADLLDGPVNQVESATVVGAASEPTVGYCWVRRLLLFLLPLLLLLIVAAAVYQARPCGFHALFAPSFRWVGGPPPT